MRVSHIDGGSLTFEAVARIVVIERRGRRLAWHRDGFSSHRSGHGGNSDAGSKVENRDAE